MNRPDLNIFLRDIRKKVFYGNGLLITIAVLLVFIYRMTVLSPTSIDIMFVTIPTITALIYLFYNPKVCIVLITLWMPLRELLIGGLGDNNVYAKFAILPNSMKYLEMYFLGLLTIKWLSRKIFFREPYRKTSLDLPIIIFSLISLFSAIWNLIPPVIGLAGWRTFLQFALFYYAIVQLDFEEIFLKRMVILYLITAMIQTPFSLYNFLFGEGFEMAKGDSTVGTLGGGTNYLALYEAMMMCIALGLVKFNAKKAFKYGLLFFWYMISFFTASGRSSLYLLPIASLFVINQDIKKFIDFIKAYSVYFIVVLVAIMFFYFSGIKDLYYGEKMEDLDPSWIYEQFFLEDTKTQWRGGRARLYTMAWESVNEVPLGYLAGVGPGMFLSNTGIYFEVPLFERYNMQSLWDGEKIAAKLVYPPDIAVILGEFGILGLLAFGLIIFKIYQIIKNGIKWLDDPFWRGISAGMLGVFVINVAASFGERTFEAVFMQYILWFFPAIIYKMTVIKQDSIQELK